MQAFHYAFKVKDIKTTRRFYVDILGSEEGRSTENWIDFNFFGNQLSAHVNENIPEPDYCGKVDGISLPVPHFGCLLHQSQFDEIQKRLENAKIKFVVKPYMRYERQNGEQRTMFVFDLSGNPLEFKSFSNQNEVFS